MVELATEPNSESADAYTVLDPFDRVIDQRWSNTFTTTSVDRYDYGYDRNGNRMFKENLLSSVNSELFAYDGMNRVTDMQRGTLSTAKNGLVGVATRAQSWRLNALGKSTSVTSDFSYEKFCARFGQN